MSGIAWNWPPNGAAARGVSAAFFGGGSGIAIARATDMLRQVKAESEATQASEEAV